MPLPRFENLATEQRERIMSAARGEFARHGYEQASLARVAEAAGISKGTLYYYFADRDDLYASVVMQLVQAVARQPLLGSFAPKNAAEYWPALEKLFHAGFELARRHPEEMRALRSFQTSLRRNPRPAFEPVLQQMAANLRKLVETGRKLKCVRTDISSALLVEMLQQLDEVFDRMFYTEELGSDARAFERHVALALDTFRRLTEPRPAAAVRPARTRKARLS
jgi:AcrR family transcriptional regulator